MLRFFLPDEDSSFLNFQRLFIRAPNGWALAASGWDETTPFYRNQLQATQNARKRADSHLSAARRVRRNALTEPDFSIQKRQSAVPHSGQLEVAKPLVELAQRYHHDAQTCQNATPRASITR